MPQLDEMGRRLAAAGRRSTLAESALDVARAERALAREERCTARQAHERASRNPACLSKISRHDAAEFFGELVLELKGHIGCAAERV